MSNFEGQVAIVTGGANGIGRATAELLFELGAKVIAFDREQPAGKSGIENVTIDLGNLPSLEGAVSNVIKKYGRKNLNEGSLCNMTDGGDGIWNCKRSEETKKKLSEQKKGDKNPQYGKTPSKETLIKRSLSLSGLKRSDVAKKRQSINSGSFLLSIENVASLIKCSLNVK